MRIYNASTCKVILQAGNNLPIEIPAHPGSVQINTKQYERFKKTLSFVAMCDRGQLLVDKKPTGPADPKSNKEKPAILKPNEDPETNRVKTKVKVSKITLEPPDDKKDK